MHTAWSLSFLLPAAICALGCWLFAHEAANERRFQSGHAAPDWAPFLKASATASACLAGMAICMAPVALYAIDSGFGLGLVR